MENETKRRESDYVIEHRFGQGFFFGWTFGLGLFLALTVAAMISRLLNEAGFSFFNFS